MISHEGFEGLDPLPFSPALSLLKGNTFSWDAQNGSIASTNSSALSTPATVTIINSVAPSLPAVAQQTFVISPVTLSTVSGAVCPKTIRVDQRN